MYLEVKCWQMYYKYIATYVVLANACLLESVSFRDAQPPELCSNIVHKVLLWLHFQLKPGLLKFWTEINDINFE